jgi:DEAD/DEAH box helicase domain-containing protein
MLNSFLVSNNWDIVSSQTIEERQGQLFPMTDVNLSDANKNLLLRKYPEGLYLHQKLAIQEYQTGKNVCMTTGTASGKSLPFYITGIEALQQRSKSKVMALYPLKALGSEQEQRWNMALNDAGLDARVGRIDGSVAIRKRPEILKNSDIIIATPDILHAWMLPNISNKNVYSFISNLSLVIADEIHTYTGVFGSNAAFLFRRLEHCCNLLGGDYQYLAASATIAQPANHLQKLFGRDFCIINSEKDTSPSYPLQVNLIQPPGEKDLLTEVSQLMGAIAKHSDKRFITFVNSRKQTELLSSIMFRDMNKVNTDDEQINFSYDYLDYLDVLPYRAGYEEVDRKRIQERFSNGKLKGIVSTSALELGIDIQGLEIEILVGVPFSLTSLYQRMGRVGRSSPGEVYIINTGSVYDEAIFRKPEELFERPLSDTALYLENQRIQYIHTMCLAREGGEHDQVCNIKNLNQSDPQIETSIIWPPGFLELVKKEKTGEIPIELQSMKAQGAEVPHYVFPLRDVEPQFKVEYKVGPEQRNMGSLSFGQLMREAYPGAIYYYATTPYRVYKVNTRHHTVQIRQEKRYTTRPLDLKTNVYPNLSGENNSAFQLGDLLVVECDLQINEIIHGFKEHRGPNETSHQYPLSGGYAGLYYERPAFSRSYFTTGVLFYHPVFQLENIRIKAISDLIYEAFLMEISFERQDINCAADVYKGVHLHLPKQSKFVCIFDQTYGSLHLTGRLMDPELLQRVFQRAIELASSDPADMEVNEETINVLVLLRDELTNNKQQIEVYSEEFEEEDNSIKVIIPGSIGLAIMKDSRPYLIKSVFFSPKEQTVCYSGRYEDSLDKVTSIIFPIDRIAPTEESQWGFYNLETGEVTAIA